MFLCATLMLTLSLLQEIPFKPADEFDIVLDYEFRERPHVQPPVYLSTGQHQAVNRSGVLPYLTLQMTFHKLPEERMRMRVTADHPQWRTTTRRIVTGETYPLTLGYIADMVDRVTAQMYTVTFLDANRNPVNCIVIRIADDGTFLINDEKKGRF